MKPTAPSEFWTDEDDDALAGYCHHADPITAHDLAQLFLPALAVAAGCVGLALAAAWNAITWRNHR